ncbi:hypothetical protein F2Q68_00015382 [Brassica cretica]|uniref:Uncharacterized protein n=1 Tax=Brassica cretica TaxID=69181 RepID=A0A8S9HES8_BRACR|nr:hypothetical protein F2Q68_00015382 [Brassica cretica]
MVGENGGGAAPSSDEAAGEEGASSARCELCGGAEETSALGLGQDLGLFQFKDCAVTNRLSFFLSRFLPDSYRCKFRDRFSAYTTCLIRIEHLSGDRKC